jgi:HEPN domain-containing protein
MDGSESRAEAYLAEARTTLEGARILFETREDAGSAQVVNNAYAALEHALSAGIARDRRGIPRRHRQKVLEFFDLYDDDELLSVCLKWQSRRESARYVDFDGPELSFRGTSSVGTTQRKS